MLELLLNRPTIVSNGFCFGDATAFSFDDEQVLWLPEKKRIEKVWKKTTQNWLVAQLLGSGYFHLDDHEPLPLPEDPRLSMRIDEGQARMTLESDIDVGWTARLENGLWTCANGETGKNLFVCSESFVAPDAPERRELAVGPRSRLSALAV